MKNLFGDPKWVTDKRGVTHLSYTALQSVERLVHGLADTAKALANTKLMLMPKPNAIGKRNRTEWLLKELRVGGHFDYEKDEHIGGFLVRVELADFGSVCEPALVERILWLVNVAIPTRERRLIVSCYTPEGYYIGDLDTAGWLYFNHRLTQVQPIDVAMDPSKKQKAIQEKTACQIGFDEKNQRWMGWSHRAFSGFDIGYVAKEGDCVVTSGWTDEYLAEHPEHNLSVPVGFEVKNLDDSKRCAIAYAESIS